MISIELSTIANILGWQLVGDDLTINHVCTDSRKVTKGDCFIALYGENFDAHSFIPSVIEQGASALIVSKEQKNCPIPQLIVSDTRLALADIAGLNKSLANVKTIAITGSCGKTTVKEMINAILSQDNHVLATHGNFNNDIGVPLTLLRLTDVHEYAIIELGANHIGEIDFTSNITKPDVSIITNIGEAHLEGFGGIEGVVTAKSEIFNHLTASGCAIFDGESEYATLWLAKNKNRKITCFKSSHSNDGSDVDEVWAQDISVNDQGCAKFTLCKNAQRVSVILPLPGLHNVKNALAASAAVLALGFDLQYAAQGLTGLNEVKGRLNVTKLSPYLTVIDDTYNANSSSIAAAVDVLSNYHSKRILILGDMAELGEFAVESHQSLGEKIEKSNIDILLTYGDLSVHYAHGYHGEHHHFKEKEALNLYINKQLMLNSTVDETTVLVKGSRSAAMESVVEFIKNNNKNNIGATQQC